MPRQSRHRNYCFTWNNYPEDHESKLKELEDVQYGVFGKEVAPTTGTPHLQGYLQFTKKIGFVTLQSKFPWSITAAKGSPDQNFDYCSKDGDFIEWGTRKNQGKRNDIATAYERVRQGKRERDIAEEFPVVHAKYHRGIERYRSLVDYDETKAFRTLNVSVYWGDAGTGKTRSAIEQSEDYYILNAPTNGTLWFDGYQGEKTLIIDDFYGWIKFHDILRILDGYQMRLPVKGGFCYAKWERVFITSNKRPSEWYPNIGDQRQIDALNRRINEIKEM